MIRTGYRPTRKDLHLKFRFRSLQGLCFQRTSGLCLAVLDSSVRRLLDIEDCAEALPVGVMEIRYFAEVDRRIRGTQPADLRRNQDKAGKPATLPKRVRIGFFSRGHGEYQKRRFVGSRDAL